MGNDFDDAIYDLRSALDDLSARLVDATYALEEVEGASGPGSMTATDLVEALGERIAGDMAGKDREIARLRGLAQTRLDERVKIGTRNAELTRQIEQARKYARDLQVPSIADSAQKLLVRWGNTGSFEIPKSYDDETVQDESPDKGKEA